MSFIDIGQHWLFIAVWSFKTLTKIYEGFLMNQKTLMEFNQNLAFCRPLVKHYHRVLLPGRFNFKYKTHQVVKNFKYDFSYFCNSWGFSGSMCFDLNLTDSWEPAYNVSRDVRCPGTIRKIKCYPDSQVPSTHLLLLNVVVSVNER